MRHLAFFVLSLTKQNIGNLCARLTRWRGVSSGFWLLTSVFLFISGSREGFSQTAVPLNTVPSRIVGHANPETNGNIASANPNLVEGRELYAPWTVALDMSVS